MTPLLAIILGIIEGVTEFIPVSSSGHLILARDLLHLPVEGTLAFDAVLQFAAACALVVYFWKDILNLLDSLYAWAYKRSIADEDRILLLAIIYGSIPVLVAGLFLETQMNTIFRNSHLVALSLIWGSILMWYAEKVATQKKSLSIQKGVVVGFFQALALIPGVSRSGATISGGLIAGISKDEAVRFAFILSIPVLFGSGLLKLIRVGGELVSPEYGLPLLLGSLVSFFTAFWAIHFLIKYLRKHSLKVFIWYRIVVAILIFIVL